MKNRGKTCTGNRVLMQGAVVSRYSPVSPVLSHGANLAISTGARCTSSTIGEGKELRVSDSPEVPEWVAKIVAEFALREGIDAEKVVRLLIIQGALAYEKAYREEGLQDR